MTAPAFSFSRSPGTKTRTTIQPSLITPANNTVVLIGHMAAAGSTATAGVPYTVTNFGDPVKALAECATEFGAGSELGGMVVAAINGVLESTLPNQLFPPIVCVPLAHADTSANLAATLNNLLSYPMPYPASCYPGTDAAAQLALTNYLNAISGEDRGRFGQFGSICSVGIVDTYAHASAVGLASGSEKFCFPWMMDTAGTPANTPANIAAAMAALLAANARPYNPLTDIVVGGVSAQVSPADWHSPGDSGTEALGLAAGLTPLMTNRDGTVSVSRAITAYAPVANTVASSYFDVNDWQVLFDYREQCYVRAQLPIYKNVKASLARAAALNSDFISIAKLFEDLEMFENVDQLAGEFTFARSPANRAAFVYSAPVNVIPGFYNKGIEIVGTTQFDVVAA